MSSLHVVFDLDDTLYPERDYAIGGFEAAARWARDHLAIDIDARTMTALLDDGHLGALFKITLEQAKPDYTPDDLRSLHQAYAQHPPALNLFPDAAAALTEFHGLHALGLITDGHAPTQTRKVEALGIADRFNHIIYTGALGPDRAFHKPHPRAFELMEQALGQPGDRYVYIGDNPAKDFLAPNQRGWSTVEIDRPHHRSTRIHKTATAVPGGSADHRIESLRDLSALIAEID